VNGLVIFVPRMIKAYAGKTDCHIAATSSWGGWTGGAITAPYSAAKAAVNNLMESYYYALQPYGIGSTSLCPMAINSDIYKAEKYRPEKLRNSGYHTTDDVIDLMRAHCENGMDPVTLAEHLKCGIENDQLFVVPYDNAYEMISRVHEQKRNFAFPEGMLKEKAVEEYMKGDDVGAPDNQLLREKGPVVGFGAARSDIEWVDESRKFG
jgi:short-subunit dehydrogenase